MLYIRWPLIRFGKNWMKSKMIAIYRLDVGYGNLYKTQKMSQIGLDVFLLKSSLFLIMNFNLSIMGTRLKKRMLRLLFCQPAQKVPQIKTKM